ncbi:kinase-like domain-containing protein [Chytriomyces sp. MP71]|nr:kinase-like domain-containing protein [Chytriomyces sp. MP71]
MFDFNNVNSTTTLEFTFVNDSLSCHTSFYTVHVAFAYLTVIAGLLCMITRLHSRLYFLHGWFGRLYIIFMLWATAASIVIHNNGLPTGVLYSFLWVMLGLTFGWLAIAVHMKRVFKVTKPRGDETTFARVMREMLSLKAFHGCAMFLSWINIAGRLFVTPLSNDFGCYSYPAYKQIKSKDYAFNGTTGIQFLPWHNPDYNLAPWANKEQQWAAELSLGPLAAAFIVGSLVNAFQRKKLAEASAVNPDFLMFDANNPAPARWDVIADRYTPQLLPFILSWMTMGLLTHVSSQLQYDLGSGAYGVVCAARHNETGKDVAIKKVVKVFEKSMLAKRALREIKLLRHFHGHQNITGLWDMEISDPIHFNEIYLVQDLMEADLHQIIYSGQSLSDPHLQYFMYQLCRGLKYIHSANVLHRDLKPSNLLVNADCELKICDFGLARGLAAREDSGFMTEYVATRWYRAPEIMLRARSYTKAIDMWSVGCIFAELLGSRVLFKGTDYVDQLNQIINVLGSPVDDDAFRAMASERSQVYIRSLPKKVKIPWNYLFPDATPFALDFLESLVKFTPDSRATVEEALAHPYLEAYHDVACEPSHGTVFDFGFENLESVEEMKGEILFSSWMFIPLTQRIQAIIVEEVVGYRARRTVQASSTGTEPNLRPKETDQVGSVPKSVDEDGSNAMDMDDELEHRGQ